MLARLWLPLLQMCVMEKKETREKRLTESRLKGWSWLGKIGLESCFLSDGEKNLIYEANIANPPTVEVISKTFKNPTDVIFIREKPQHLLICYSLGIGRFYLSTEKPLAQYSKISVDRLKQPLLVKESNFGLLTVRIRQLSFSVWRVARQRPSSTNLKNQQEEPSCQS